MSTLDSDNSNKIDKTQGKDKKIQLVAGRMQLFFSGPFPPPEIFKNMNLSFQDQRVGF